MQSALWFPPKSGSMLVSCSGTLAALANSSRTSDRETGSSVPAVTDRLVAQLVANAAALPAMRRLARTAGDCAAAGQRLAALAQSSGQPQMQMQASMQADSVTQQAVSGTAPTRVRILSEWPAQDMRATGIRRPASKSSSRVSESLNGWR